MIIAHKSAARFFWLSLLCVAAAFLNLLFMFLTFDIFRIPLFVDSVFTAAVTFYAGPVPGLAVVLIHLVFRFLIIADISLFVIVSIVEVIIIWRLKPDAGIIRPAVRDRWAFTETVTVFASLMLLYIATGVTASVLGGLIDYVHFSILGHQRQFFSQSDVFSAGFYGSGIHQLAVGILSRIPVNLIDRAIVIFGGYFIALGIKKIGERLLKEV